MGQRKFRTSKDKRGINILNPHKIIYDEDYKVYGQPSSNNEKITKSIQNFKQTLHLKAKKN